ncbi:MAG: hypothetical protein ABL879_09485 [Devosia sp.]
MSEPLRTTTFTLTRADALAYERYARPMGWRRVVGLAIWLALAWPILWLIPDNWSGTPMMPTFWALAAVLLAINYTLAMIVWAIGDMRRARRRVHSAHDVVLEEFAESVSVTGAGIPRYLKFADDRVSVTTESHLFVGTGPNAVIIPRRAFIDDSEFDALAARFEGAVPPVGEPAAELSPPAASPPTPPVEQAAAADAPVPIDPGRASA